VQAKRQTGARAGFRGACAEDAVAGWYRARGGDILEQRWRGTSGEIDLIVRLSGVVIFCEVKSSKHRSRAAHALSERQMRRICHTASEYLGTLPEGELTEMQFDFAVVDPQGVPDIMQNAFSAP